jgi:hypothetical protein
MEEVVVLHLMNYEHASFIKKKSIADPMRLTVALLLLLVAMNHCCYSYDSSYSVLVSESH